MSEEEKTTATPEEPAEEQEREATEAEKLTKKIKRSEKSVKRYQWFLLRLLLLIVVIWVLLFKVVGLVRMPSGDMYPRMDAGDMTLFYRLEKNVRAQDIVVISKATPDSEGAKQLYISRVIACPGDTVEITESGHVIVNGNTLVEGNIFYTTPLYEGFVEYPVQLGEDEYFVLADKRNGGEDSRYFGPVKKSELVGTVITILRRNNL
jgi:signal peptidase I